MTTFRSTRRASGRARAAGRARRWRGRPWPRARAPAGAAAGQGAEDRGARRDARAGRLLGPGQQVLRRDHGRDVQRAGRGRDRRRALPDRDHQHRRPARPKRALGGRGQLLAEGVRYIIGPNVDTTAAVIVPLLRSGNAVNIAYGFGRYLYAPPQRHSILGMVASYQASPIIYDYLKQTKGIRSVSFVARRGGGLAEPARRERRRGPAARAGGRLLVLHLRAGTLDFRPVMARVLAGRDPPPVLKGITGQLGGPAAPVGGRPDLIELSGVAPADAPLILIALRELGYGGLVCTETAQDALLLRDAGEAAEGFISVGGGLAPGTLQPLQGGFRAPLHGARRPLARRGRHQGLRARDDPAHAPGGRARGDRGRDARSWRPSPPSPRTTRSSRTSRCSATAASGPSTSRGRSGCRWS